MAPTGISRFRRIASPLGVLIFLWFRPISDLGFQMLDPSKALSREFPFVPTDFLILMTMTFLIFILMIGLWIWGYSANHEAWKVRRNSPREGRDQLALIVLLATSSIPSVFLLMLVAKPLGLTRHEIFDLAQPIVGTPMVLGWIWLRLQAPDSASARQEVADEIRVEGLPQG